MRIKLKGGTIYDPAHQRNGEVGDVVMADGVIVDDTKCDEEIDVTDHIIMAGGIDIHSHIAGGKLNIARMLLPELHSGDCHDRDTAFRLGSGEATMTSFATGYRYAEMGFTAAFEPAMIPANARQTHCELDDVPLLDKGCYAVMGNDDFLLRLISRKASQQEINNYVAFILESSKALAIKVVNPGGINAFKFNQRSLDLDEKNHHYDITPRDVLLTLTRAVHELGVPHPLHLHGCNLGIPGNVGSTLKTIDAVSGLPLHLTHVQFHSYGDEGDRNFSSAAAPIAEAVNANKNITIDVGQIMFGQTVTISADIMHQHGARGLASPKKSFCMDIECQGGCGAVPFRYRDRHFVNALQWLIGLELFLLVEDPWRVFLTTDHPNGAPFTCYPHLMRLLMDRSFRADVMETLSPAAVKASILPSLEREYSLYEIAIMTRAAPARILGLSHLGHLGATAQADVAVYRKQSDCEQMFASPRYVFKKGQLVVRDGQVVDSVAGSTHYASFALERQDMKDIDAYYRNHLGSSYEEAMVGDEVFCGFEGSGFAKAS